MYRSRLLILTTAILVLGMHAYASLDDVMLGYHPLTDKSPLAIRDTNAFDFITQASWTIDDNIDAVLWLETGMMLSGSAEGNLRLYDPSLAQLDVVSGLGTITDLGAMHNGNVAVCTSEGYLYVYSVVDNALSQVSFRDVSPLSFISLGVQSTDHIVVACYNGNTQHLKRVTSSLGNAGGAVIPNTDANSVDLVVLSDDRVGIALDDQQVRLISPDMSTRLAYYKDGNTPGNGYYIFDVDVLSDDTLVLAYRRLSDGTTAIRLRGGETLGTHVGYRGFPGYGDCVAVTSDDEVVYAGTGGVLRLLATPDLGNLAYKTANANGLEFGDIYVQGAPPVTITAPLDRVVAGAAIDILWDANSSAGSNVKIEFSRDNGNTWSIVADSTVNDGSYQWIVPDIISTECLIRITEDTYYNFNVNDQPFEIFECAVPDLNGDCISNIPDIQLMASDWLSNIDN
ncbi:MAG: hypothetical protein ACIAQZ_08295 [Sedimentisphaeraceae bacterium JB056]